MDEALKIIAIIALSSLTILVIFGMVFLSKTIKIFNNISNNFDKITETVTGLKGKINQAMDDVSEAKSDIKDMKQRSFNSMEKFDESNKSVKIFIDNINEHTESIYNAIRPYEDLASKTYNRVAPPINKASAMVSALTKAVSVFASRFSNNQRSREEDF